MMVGEFNRRIECYKHLKFTMDGLAMYLFAAFLIVYGIVNILIDYLFKQFVTNVAIWGCSERECCFDLVISLHANKTLCKCHEAIMFV